MTQVNTASRPVDTVTFGIFPTNMDDPDWNPKRQSIIIKI